MSFWSRLRKAIDKLVDVLFDETEVIDLRGAEKEPPRKKPTPSRPRAKPLEPRPMPPGYEDAIDIGDLVRNNPEPIADYMSPDDIDQQWLYTWDMIPTGDMSSNQIQTTINMIEDQLETADWDDIWDELREDFWDWYRERYTS